MKTNGLPKYWIVKADGSKLFGDEVIHYLNQTYGMHWSGDANNYYGYDGSPRYNGPNCYFSKENFANNPVELTLEEFIKLKNEDVEWIPKKDLETKTTTKWPDKKILGYKLVKPEYEKAVSAILKNDSWKLITSRHHFLVNCFIDYALQEAGVRDLWFEPVYKEESKTLILGTSKIPVKISKDKIEVDGGNKIDFSRIEQLFYDLQDKAGQRIMGSHKDYPVRFNQTATIGCSEFTQEDIREVIKTYREINNI